MHQLLRDWWRQSMGVCIFVCSWVCVVVDLEESRKWRHRGVLSNFFIHILFSYCCFLKNCKLCCERRKIENIALFGIYCNTYNNLVHEFPKNFWIIFFQKLLFYVWQITERTIVRWKKCYDQQRVCVCVCVMGIKPLFSPIHVYFSLNLKIFSHFRADELENNLLFWARRDGQRGRKNWKSKKKTTFENNKNGLTVME